MDAKGVSGMSHRGYFITERLQPDQEENIKLLNLAAIDFGNAIRDCVPPCTDQRDCMKKLRAIVYLGEAAIKLRGDL